MEAGLAITVMLRNGIRPGQRILDERDGFPPLGEAGIVLLRTSADSSPLVERLETVIANHFKARALGLVA